MCSQESFIYYIKLPIFSLNQDNTVNLFIDVMNDLNPCYVFLDNVQDYC